MLANLHFRKLSTGDTVPRGYRNKANNNEVNVSMNQSMRWIPYEPFLPLAQIKNTADIQHAFSQQQPLALEIGCGKGEFICQLAQTQPQRNYLATDIFNKGCLKAAGRCQRLGLDNLRVTRAEARYLLADIIAPGSLQQVYINCPDPWPKRRHRHRRLVNQEFLQLLAATLAPGGDFFFASDFADYAFAVADLLPHCHPFDNMLEVPWAYELPDYPRSKYMQRFLDIGLPIYYLHWRRNHRVCSKPATLSQGFRPPQDK